MKYGSLFTGIGGFDLGFDRSGMRGEWQVERDKDCNRVLGKQWPSVQRGTEVRDVTRERFGAVDVICGGFPCQDVSVAGKRKGLAGERSGLWSEFHRIIAEFAPRICVIENVPGLFSSNGGLDFLTIIRGLAELGYCVAGAVLDSQYRGVAQRRDRVFIVGSLGNGSCAEILFEPESLRGDSAPSREARKEVAGTIGGSSQSGGFRTTDLDNNGAFVVNGGGQVAVAIPIQEIGKRQSGNSMNGVGHGKDGDPMFTLQRSAEHGIYIPSGVRRLTPRECERLQGFPDDWTRWDAEGKEISDSARYRMLGNAVTVTQAEWLGNQIAFQ